MVCFFVTWNSLQLLLIYKLECWDFLLAEELCPTTRIILHQNLEADRPLCRSERLRALWAAVYWKEWDRSRNKPSCPVFRTWLYPTPDKTVCRRNKAWFPLPVNVSPCPGHFVPAYSFPSFSSFSASDTSTIWSWRYLNIPTKTKRCGGEEESAVSCFICQRWNCLLFPLEEHIGGIT